jgi:hypothetical protein
MRLAHLDDVLFTAAAARWLQRKLRNAPLSALPSSRSSLVDPRLSRPGSISAEISPG